MNKKAKLFDESLLPAGHDSATLIPVVIARQTYFAFSKPNNNWSPTSVSLCAFVWSRLQRLWSGVLPGGVCRGDVDDGRQWQCSGPWWNGHGVLVRFTVIVGLLGLSESQRGQLDCAATLPPDHKVLQAVERPAVWGLQHLISSLQKRKGRVRLKVTINLLKKQHTKKSFYFKRHLSFHENLKSYSHSKMPLNVPLWLFKITWRWMGLNAPFYPLFFMHRDIVRSSYQPIKAHRRKENITME